MPRKGAPWSLATCRPASNRGLTPNTGSLFRRKPQRRRRRMTTMMSRPVFSSSSARRWAAVSLSSTSSTDHSRCAAPDPRPYGLRELRRRRRGQRGDRRTRLVGYSWPGRATIASTPRRTRSKTCRRRQDVLSSSSSVRPSFVAPVFRPRLQNLASYLTPCPLSFYHRTSGIPK